jgi:anti-anti-sigma regulatory factor
MAIRIDMKSEGPEVVVCLAGRLSDEDVINELRDTCDSIKGPFVLDLSTLIFADDAGVEVIRTLREKGVHVRGASTFIQLLTNDEKTSGAENDPETQTNMR